MRRVAVAIAVGAIAVVAAAPAQGYQGPCSKQAELFEKYNVQVDMNAPLVSYAYGETCSRTG